MKVSYITVVGVIAFGAIAYLIWKKRQENAAKTGGTTGSTAAAAPSGPTPPSTSTGAGSTGNGTTGTIKTFTAFEKSQYLIKGSSGDQVKALQSFLNDNAINNAAPLTIDGQFGQATENALSSQFNRVSISLDMLNISGFDSSTNKYITGWGENPGAVFGIVFD